MLNFSKVLVEKMDFLGKENVDIFENGFIF